MTVLARLKPSDFDSLKGVSDGFRPDPDSSIAIVGRDDGEITARIFLLAPTHIEGPWIREDKRNTGLAAQLMARIEQEAKDCGINTVFAYAVSEEIEGYLQRLGYSKKPMTVWSKEI